MLTVSATTGVHEPMRWKYKGNKIWRVCVRSVSMQRHVLPRGSGPTESSRAQPLASSVKSFWNLFSSKYQRWSLKGKQKVSLPSFIFPTAYTVFLIFLATHLFVCVEILPCCWSILTGLPLEARVENDLQGISGALAWMPQSFSV